ncbi:MAG TPA: response regulator [Motiliproteus sp.]
MAGYDIPTQSLTALQGKRFLVVDDEPVNLQFYQNFFEDLDLELVLANDGDQAVEQVLTHPPDYFAAVLMDIRMPGMNGTTATQQIKAHPDWAALPIIAMSGNALAQDRDYYLQAGMCDLLAKPAPLQAIIAMLVKWVAHDPAVISSHPEPPIASPSTAPPADAQLPLTQVDVAQRLAETGLSLARYRKLLQLFATSSPPTLVELQTHLAQQRFAAAADNAHRLAGACGNIGANQLRFRCKALQHACDNQQLEAAQQLLPDLQAQLKQLYQEISELDHAAP